MDITIQPEELIAHGLAQPEATKLAQAINTTLHTSDSRSQAWRHLAHATDLTSVPFAIHLWLFSMLFPDWRHHPHLYPVWEPTPASQKATNLYHYQKEKNLPDINALQQWTHQHYQDYWADVITKLNIRFFQKPSAIIDLHQATTTPRWLPNASMNMAESCFNADPDAIAIICQEPSGSYHNITYRELDRLSNRIANSLVASGLQAGDGIAIVMPMNIQAVAIYLGIIKMGGIVISVPDSFSAVEIRTRLTIVDTKLVFTQDKILWAGKSLALYQKLCQAIDATTPMIVLPQNTRDHVALREDDTRWDDFLVENDQFDMVACDPNAPMNILFSSGTTSTPKAIPWTHTTPIKVGADAYFHQNIQPGDVLAWPTSLGWMMGPWLIYAALLNQATIALFPDAPKDTVFGKFVEKAGVTMLGVVPTLVSSWRNTQCMESLDWSAIKLVSSTGECSNPEDMFYLMWLTNYKPIIEYCGGTEIGGAYITSTLLDPNAPSVLTSPAMGSAFVLLDENGHESKMGEVALIPPSLGYSTTLLNQDHFKTYFADMPYKNDIQLRRHGDQVKCLDKRAFMMLGRVDDSMNLGGIKVSSSEIERTIKDIEGVQEVAAIAIAPPHNGPSQLVVFATLLDNNMDRALLQKTMQQHINRHLNPLFKIHDLVIVSTLPKTASNKIMRRELRKKYEVKCNF